MSFKAENRIAGFLNNNTLFEQKIYRTQPNASPASVWQAERPKQLGQPEVSESNIFFDVSRNEALKSENEAIEEIYNNAFDDEDYFTVDNVNVKTTKKILEETNIPSWYEINVYEFDDGVCSIEFRAVKDMPDSIKWASQMQFHFEQNADLENIGPTDSRDYNFLGAEIPENYRHDVTELDNGKYMHSFIYIGPVHITKEDNELIEEALLVYGDSVYKFHNLENLDEVDKIKVPDGYLMTMPNQNKYGYYDVMIIEGKDKEKCYAAKLKYCLSKKLEVIVPEADLDVNGKLYGVKIPTDYTVSKSKGPDGKMYSVLTYKPKVKDNSAAKTKKERRNKHRSKHIKSYTRPSRHRTMYKRGNTCSCSGNLRQTWYRLTGQLSSDWK